MYGGFISEADAVRLYFGNEDSLLESLRSGASDTWKCLQPRPKMPGCWELLQLIPSIIDSSIKRYYLRLNNVTIFCLKA
jgi:hypothetical protein